MSFPHEAFLRALRALCDEHGVEVHGTEKDGVLVVPVTPDRDSAYDPIDVDRFVYVSFDEDGDMFCNAARLNKWGRVDLDYERQIRINATEKKT